MTVNKIILSNHPNKLLMKMEIPLFKFRHTIIIWNKFWLEMVVEIILRVWLSCNLHILLLRQLSCFWSQEPQWTCFGYAILRLLTFNGACCYASNWCYRVLDVFFFVHRLFSSVKINWRKWPVWVPFSMLLMINMKFRWTLMLTTCKYC